MDELQRIWIIEQVNSGKSINSISKQTGIRWEIVNEMCGGGKRDRPLSKTILANDKDWLREQYESLGRGMKDIAIECGVSEDSVRTRLRKFGIQIRNHKDALAIRNKKYPNSPSEESRKEQSEIRKTGITVECAECGKGFYRHKRGTRIFCSMLCRRKFQRDTRNPTSQFWRDTLEYKTWRLSVYKRDGYRCTICKSREIHAHHIKPGHGYPELRYDMSNGITLCREHHNIVHSPFSQEWLKQTGNIGGSPEVDNPEAALERYLKSLIRSND